MKQRPTLGKPAPPEFPYVCGYCGVGNHKGTEHLSASGARQRACSHLYYVGRRLDEVECMCPCNDTEREFRTMMAEMGRQIVSAASVPSVLPAPSLRARVTNAPSPVSAPVPASPFGDRPPIAVLKGGRVAKGELERLVFEVITDPVVGVTTGYYAQMTPKQIADEIRMRTGGGYEPSVGAIYSRLEAWSKNMLVTVEEKPYRVTAVSDKLRVD